MAKGHTIPLNSPHSRHRAHQLIERASDGYVCEIRPPTRSNDANNKMWAMLTDISLAKPEGRMHSPEVWKTLAMHACGHEVQFLNGLNGEPFPAGFRSSRLSVAQMSELIEFLYEFGARHGVRWSEPQGACTQS
jgi:hypothetical protein